MKQVEDQDFMVVFPECSQYSAQNQKERWSTKIYTYFRIRQKEQRFRFIRNYGCFLKKKDPSAEENRNQASGA